MHHITLKEKSMHACNLFGGSLPNSAALVESNEICGIGSIHFISLQSAFHKAHAWFNCVYVFSYLEYTGGLRSRR